MKSKFLLFATSMILVVQTLVAQVPSYVPTNGLVGYWPFNGNANDESGNGNNGTVNGPTLTVDRFGNSNRAFSYNAGSSLICTNQNINNPNSLTYSIWFKTNSTIGGHLIGFNNGQCSHGGTWDRALWVENNKVVFYTFPGFEFQHQAFINVVDNNWHNCVITMDNVGSKIYIDSNLISSNNSQLNGQNYNGFFRFGGLSPNDINNSLIGSYDDIGIWNRALTQQEITTMYNGSQTSSYTDTCNAVSGSLIQGLVGYWPFCGNANDDSGNGNNGTVNGATLTADRFGNSNSAYSFNGTNNYISVPANSLPTVERTVSAWVKCDGALNGGTSPFDYQTLLDYGSAGGILLKMTDFKWLYNYGPNNQPTSNTSINQSIWYNLVFTLDSNANCNFFINGNLVGSGNITNFTPVDLSQWSSIASFGRSSNNAWYWNGKLDDIGIWNRVLSQAEVTQLYNQNQCFTNITVTDTLIINVGQLSYTNPIAYSNNITIAPNPASTQININFNNITDLNGGTLKIINALGQQVATTPITTSGTNTTLSLATWGGNGMYFVQIINPQGQIVDIKKIILQ